MDARDRNLHSDWFDCLTGLKSLCVVLASGIAGFGCPISVTEMLVFFFFSFLYLSTVLVLCEERFCPLGNEMADKPIFQFPVEKNNVSHLDSLNRGRIYSCYP